MYLNQRYVGGINGTLSSIFLFPKCPKKIQIKTVNVVGKNMWNFLQVNHEGNNKSAANEIRNAQNHKPSETQTIYVVPQKM